MARDERVIFFGEDVAIAGGVFAVTPGLDEKHGSERVFDTPISELAIDRRASAPPSPACARCSRSCSPTSCRWSWTA